MISRRSRTSCFLLFAPIFFCIISLTANAAETQVLNIGGTGSALATMRLLGADFERNNDIQVNILPPIGTQGGIIALQEGALDLALVAQPVHLQEQQSDFVYRPYAKTAVAFVADPNCSLSNLSEQELVDILRGSTRAWPEGQYIRLVMRSLNESDFIPVAEFSPALRDALSAASQRKDIVFSATTQENARMLLNLPGSLGISSIAQIQSEHLALTTIAYNGVQPTLSHVQDGSYPFSKTFALIYPKQKFSGPLKLFVDYVLIYK